METEKTRSTMFLDETTIQKVSSLVKGKNVLVTGGTGSFGNAFISTLLGSFEPAKLIVFSRDELKQALMKEKFPETKFPQLRFLLGDVRDYSRLRRALRNVHIVIHAAALKQVPALEYNPTEAIKTNIFGAINIIEACSDCKVQNVIALSTDKAAAPINLYGATKLCSDKLFVAANGIGGVDATRYSVVRYGNVFGSRGSIVPVLHKYRQTGEIGLTDTRMTRFNISLENAVNFVLSGLALQQGGEIFIPKLPSYTLPVMAEGICPECKVNIIGRRPGEKLHELMIPADESYRTVDIGDRYIIEPEGKAAVLYERQEDSELVEEGFNYNSGNNSEWNTTEEIRQQYVEWCAYYGENPDRVKQLNC